LRKWSLGAGRCPGEEVGDRAIVAGSLGKCLAGQAAAQFNCCAAIGGNLIEDLGILAACVAIVVKAWFLAAARTNVGPPISICSMASSCVTPFRATVASTDRGSPPPVQT